MEYDPTRPAVCERLSLPGDALVLSVAAGAALVIAKDFVNIPAPWLDTSYTFLITMTLSSIIGAALAWHVHRRSFGLRGLRALALGLAVAVAAVLTSENAMVFSGAASPAITLTTFTILQWLGAVAVLALLAACAVNLRRITGVRQRAHTLARITGLATIAAMIIFRFIPETRADAQAAQVYAVLGLTTLSGALGVALGDVGLGIMNRRTPPRELATSRSRRG